MLTRKKKKIYLDTKNLKLKKKILKVLESQKISLDNYFTSNKQSITEIFQNYYWQSNLSRLVVLSIKNKMLAEFEYKNLINSFSSQNRRKIDFKWRKNWYQNLIE